MKTGGMTRSKKRLIEVVVSILKKKKANSIEVESKIINSFVPGRPRRADIYAVLSDTTQLNIQCVNQEGSGTACYKFEHYKKERDFDLSRGLNSVIVCSGYGQPESYLRYMLCHGVVFSEWFESWLDIFLIKNGH